MKINFKALEKNGYLEQSDYNALTKECLSLLNPMRVRPIRKNMHFTRLKYEVYVSECKQSQQIVEDIDDKIDLSFIPLYFVTTFSSTLFPDFQSEYFSPFDFLTNKNFVTLEGLKVIEPAQYHSLCLASFEIDQAVKTRFSKSRKFQDISEEITVSPNFLLPFKPDSEFPLTIILNVNLILK